MTGKVKLTPEKRAEALRRWRLFNENRPYKIAMDLGIHVETLSRLIHGRRRKKKASRAVEPKCEYRRCKRIPRHYGAHVV